MKLDFPLIVMLGIVGAVSGRVLYENRTRVAAVPVTIPSVAAEITSGEDGAECSTAEDLEYAYVAFYSKVLWPLAKRDGMTHTGGGCEQTDDELLCVECFSPGGEAWTWCTPDGCELADTSPELFGLGADFGACERPEQRDGLIVNFQRWANR